MHSQSIPQPTYSPKPLHPGPRNLLRFQHYLAHHWRPWTEHDDARWQRLQDRVRPASEESMLHGWIVNGLNSSYVPLSIVAAWLMQYQAGQVVVASRWSEAPHLALGLLYPEWSKMQHVKYVLGVPWYNGLA